MVRASARAHLKPERALGLAVFLGIFAATSVGVQGAGMGSGLTPARELLAETTIDASADQDSTSYDGISITSSSVSEVFEECNGEAECAACLEIDPDLNCRRDTIVNAFHCDEIDEVLCCTFYNDPDCMENKTLLKAIGELHENVCPLELSCLDGGIESLNIDGGNSDLLVATGPDAYIQPDADQGGAVVTGAEEGTDSDGEGGVAELTGGAATGTGVTTATVAAACAAAALAALTFVTAGGT